MRKVIAMLFLSLFMISMTSNTKAIIKKEKDCHEQVSIFITQADNSGNYTLEELQWLGNGALAVFCYGYTWDDVYNAP